MPVHVIASDLAHTHGDQRTFRLPHGHSIKHLMYAIDVSVESSVECGGGGRCRGCECWCRSMRCLGSFPFDLGTSIGPSSPGTCHRRRSRPMHTRSRRWLSSASRSGMAGLPTVDRYSPSTVHYPRSRLPAMIRRPSGSGVGVRWRLAGQVGARRMAHNDLVGRAVAPGARRLGGRGES